jgi:metal-dependent amidase/aminoacylase/carboxypeptidase family protein
MLEDGLYERFPRPDYALAFHVAAGQPAGSIAVPLDVVSSSSDSVDIQVRGVGTHGAYPHMGVDPVLVASQIVVSLQSIVSRQVSPLEGAVITVGSIHGGTKHNIIGERVDLQLTVRSDSPEVRERPARRHRPRGRKYRAGARCARGSAADRDPLGHRNDAGHHQ